MKLSSWKLIPRKVHQEDGMKFKSRYRQIKVNFKIGTSTLENIQTEVSPKYHLSVKSMLPLRLCYDWA